MEVKYQHQDTDIVCVCVCARVRVYIYGKSLVYIYIYIYMGRVAQSVQRLNYGLDGPGSNPGVDEIFRPS